MIDKKEGTAEIKRDKYGVWTKKEFINNEFIIGKTDGHNTRRCSFDYKNKK